jgi:stearoyl-CoA desaturase (delta-9 desaturase)
MGITVGYHRLLAHRSYQCSKFFEYFFILGGYFAYQGSPIWWSAIHRAHHKYSDTELDPHSPRKGIYHALLGWMLLGEYPPHISGKLQCSDLTKDPIYRFVECGGSLKKATLLNFAINVIYRGILWAVFGWQVALASLLASMMVFTIPQMLNVVCHIPAFGYQNFQTREDSTNVWWVGLLGLGEGWHNNHHAYPGSAQSGIRAHELDISWQMIKLGKLLGLVHTVNTPKDVQRRLAQRDGALVRLANFRRIRRKREAQSSAA